MRQQLSASLARAAPALSQKEPASFVLLFPSLSRGGKDFAFACDPHGRVDMNGMSERTRNNYLYARAMIGRDLDFPSVHAHVEGVGSSVAAPAPPRVRRGLP